MCTKEAAVKRIAVGRNQLMERSYAAGGLIVPPFDALVVIRQREIRRTSQAAGDQPAHATVLRSKRTCDALRRELTAVRVRGELHERVRLLQRSPQTRVCEVQSVGDVQPT
jgi:hypothetical protein